MVGNEIVRRTSFIHWTANLRDIIGLLWRYAPYTFRIRFDFLSILFFFGDFGCRRRKFQLYLAVECGKFGLQLFQLILLVTQTVYKASRLWRASPAPAGASAFRGCSKRFERLKRHLVVFR